jgi:hypothetical protein
LPLLTKVQVGVSSQKAAFNDAAIKDNFSDTFAKSCPASSLALLIINTDHFGFALAVAIGESKLAERAQVKQEKFQR